MRRVKNMGDTSKKVEAVKAAVLQGDAGALGRLVAAGADIGVRFSEGETLLQLALMQNDIECARILLMAEEIRQGTVDPEEFEPSYEMGLSFPYHIGMSLSSLDDQKPRPVAFAFEEVKRRLRAVIHKNELAKSEDVLWDVWFWNDPEFERRMPADRNAYLVEKLDGILDKSSIAESEITFLFSLSRVSEVCAVETRHIPGGFSELDLMASVEFLGVNPVPEKYREAIMEVVAAENGSLYGDLLETISSGRPFLPPDHHRFFEGFKLAEISPGRLMALVMKGS